MKTQKGLVKTYWADIRDQVTKVAPTFSEIVDELNPDKTFPIYLAYYPYGALAGDTESPFIPDDNGGFYRLSDPNAPKDIIKHLGYGKDSAPLGMVLDKSLEIFVDLKDQEIAIPWLICTPGSFVAFARNLNKKSNRIYMPNGVLSAVSGARSVFMLPQIGCATHHSNLQRDLNVQTPPPKSLYQHWPLFNEIINSGVVENDWRSCLMFFSEKWVNKIQNDKGWARVKAHLYEFAWHQVEYERHRVYYDIAFSVIQKKRNLKPNPYLADTARHLFSVAVGAAPAYIPASNNDFLPMELLQSVFVDSYGLKKYLPTIMQPTHFRFEQDKLPVYYSLQNPSTFVFSPKSRKMSSTLFEIRELEHIIRIFSNELSKEHAMCSDTVIGKVASQVKFNYFHNEMDRHRIIKPTKEIAKIDERFNSQSKEKDTQAKFSSDAKFLRGCISIST